LSPLVCKYIIGVPVDMDDMQRVDQAFYQSRVAPLLKPGGIAEMEAALGEPLTFVSVPTELRPEPEDLEPGGASIAVTKSNLPRYLQLLCDAFLCSEIRQELQCLLRGFWDVLPLDAVRASNLTTSEIGALISDTKRLDIGEWRQHSREEGGEENVMSSSGEPAVGFTKEVLAWFWHTVQEFSEEDRRMLLHFVTGSGRLPPGGFEALRPPFTVSVSGVVSPEHLPHANTCVHRLVLPRYNSLQQLHDKLLQALRVQEFGFA